MLPHGWFHHTVRTATVFFFILMECQAGKRALNEEDQVLEDPCFDWPVQYDNLEEYDERFPFYVHDPSSTRLIPDEQRLLNKVFRTYDNSVRPVYNATSNVVVKFGLTLIQIMDMDEQDQVLITNCWLEHEWVDERIRWDPDEYSGLHVIRIPANKLWLPDIVLYNNADDFTSGYMNTNAMVSSDGTVFWPPPARFLSSCKVDITFFPFDEQKCKMKFGSWSYDQAQVDIVNRSEIVDLSNYITNGEWSLIDAHIERNEVVYSISPAVYPDVTVYYRMRRRIVYYILNILCPCIWLNVLSLLAFCLPADAGEKVSLGITVLLSYSVFMLLIAENMPPTSEFVPLICIYLTISMAVTSISVIFTVCVLKFHHGSPGRKKAPYLLRFLVLDILQPLMRGQCKDIEWRKIYEKRPPKKTPGSLTTDNIDVCMRLMRDVQHGRHSPVAEFQASNGRIFRDYFANYNLDSETGSAMDTGSMQDEIKRLTVMEEILKNLKIMVQKRKDDDNDNAMNDEWKEIASVIDRLLFVFFSTVTGLTTLVLVVIIPATRYYDGKEITIPHHL